MPIHILNQKLHILKYRPRFKEIYRLLAIKHLTFVVFFWSWFHPLLSHLPLYQSMEGDCTFRGGGQIKGSVGLELQFFGTCPHFFFLISSFILFVWDWALSFNYDHSSVFESFPVCQCSPWIVGHWTWICYSKWNCSKCKSLTLWVVEIRLGHTAVTFLLFTLLAHFQMETLANPGLTPRVLLHIGFHNDGSHILKTVPGSTLLKLSLLS